MRKITDKRTDTAKAFDRAMLHMATDWLMIILFVFLVSAVIPTGILNYRYKW